MQKFHNELTKLPFREQFKIQTAFYIFNRLNIVRYFKDYFLWKKGILLVLYYLIALRTNVQIGSHSMEKNINNSKLFPFFFHKNVSIELMLRPLCSMTYITSGSSDSY